MAYVKQTWSCGDDISADKLNHMEQGIEDASQSGGGTSEPLIVSFDHMEQAHQSTTLFYDKTWQEIVDALTANRPVYAKYGILDGGSYEEDNASLVPIYRAHIETSGGNTDYLADAIDANAVFNEYGFYALSANGQIVVNVPPS